MHLTNLFKSILYIIIIACLSLCLYFCSTLIFTGVVTNYNKATWYYGYNQIEMNTQDTDFNTIIGYRQKEDLTYNNKNIAVLMFKDYAIDLMLGEQIKNENEIIISKEIADQLLIELKKEDYQHLIGQSFDNYIISGISKIEMQESDYICVKENSDIEIKQIILQPDSDIEALQEKGIPLNNHDAVLSYVRRIMKALEISVVLMFVALIINLILVKLSHFTFKKTVLLNGLGIVCTIFLIYIITPQLNHYITDVSYLEVGLQWNYLIIPVIFTVILNLAIKKIKFFQ